MHRSREWLGLAEEGPAIAEGDSVGAVGGAELAEEASRVGLDGVLGQVELAADLGVRATPGHPGEDLELALGEGRGHAFDGGARAAGEGVTAAAAVERLPNGGDELLAGGVLAQIATGTGSDSASDTIGVLGEREHEDRGFRVDRHETPQRLDPAQPRHAYVQQDQVGPLSRIAVEDLFPAGGRGHAGHTRESGHSAPQGLASERRIVADANSGHRNKCRQVPART